MRLAIVAMALAFGLGGTALAQSTKSDSKPAGAGQGLNPTAGDQKPSARRRTKSDARPAGASDESGVSARARADRMQKRQDDLDGSTMRSICSNCDSSGASSDTGKAGKRRKRG
jgi:hypothetical protein